MKALFGLFHYLEKHASSLWLGLALLVLSSLLGVVQPRITEWVVDAGIGPGNPGVVLRGAAAILVAGLAAAAASFGSNYFAVRAAHGMACDLRGELFSKVAGLSFSALDRYRAGELIVRLNSDVNTVRMFVRMGLQVLVQAVVLIAGALAVMFATNARLASIMAVFMPAVFAAFLLVASRIKPLFLELRKALDGLNNAIQENLAGAKTVRAFARQDAEKERFGSRNEALNRLSRKIGTAMSVLFPTFFLLAQAAVLLTLWIGGKGIIAGEGGIEIAGGLTLGQLIAFNNYAMMAMFPVLMLGFVANFLSMAAAAAERIRDLMAEDPGLEERPGALRPARLAGGVEFRGLRFRYGTRGTRGGARGADGAALGAHGVGHGAPGGGKGEDVLRGIDLVVEPGERLGIIGPTGSGKSTLVALVPRFYDPTAGAVLVDGRDARDYAFDALRGRIAIAFQETVLLAGSLRDNVAFGKPDAGLDELERAARIAGAEDVVAEKGWDGLIGERGTGLSGGQRQRVAIARAVLADPDILILDDATSSLDAATEARVVEALFAEAAGKTMILVSQKASAVMRADRIVVLDEGEIAGIGSHAELRRTNAVYRAICDTQGIEA